MTARTQSFPVRAHLIPFITRVLYRGAEERHQPTKGQVPTKDLDLYTAQDLEALRTIFPEGILYAFSHQARGWQPRPNLRGREAWASQYREERLWEAANNLSMEFEANALHLCEDLYNLCARLPKTSKDKQAPHTSRKRCIERLTKLDPNGTTTMLLYWMLVGIWPTIKTDQGQKAGRRTWGKAPEHFAQAHPLINLRYGPWLEGELSTTDEIIACIKGPQRGLLPWWISHALLWWQEEETSIWKLDAEEFSRVRARQATLLTRWIQAVESSEWLHLLDPFREFYQRQERWLAAMTLSEKPITLPHNAWQRISLDRLPSTQDMANTAVERIHASHRSLRNQDRQELREQWASVLGTSSILCKAIQKRISIHHADRENHDKFLVDWNARLQVDSSTERLEKIARKIEGRLG